MRIFAIANTRPDFIELQMKSFQKYLDEPFHFTVINNAPFSLTSNERGAINTMCGRIGASVIDVDIDNGLVARCQAVEASDKPPIFNADGIYTSVNVAAAYALCWAWENLISKVSEPICILDSDVFLMRSTKLTDYLQRYRFAYVPQARPGVEFIWPVFFLADLPRLPDIGALNWYSGKVNGIQTDVSGQTFHYLQSHLNVENLRIGQRYVQEDSTLGIPHADYETLLLEGQEIAIHYRSGSNWNGKSTEYHRIKTEWLKRLLGLEN